MSASFAKVGLSGAANGKGVKVVATGTLGTTVHTAPAGTTSEDEIWIYAFNSQVAAVTLTLAWGGAAVPDNNIVMGIRDSRAYCSSRLDCYCRTRWS